MSTVTAPVSIGELIDKITILEIKLALIDDDAKLANVRAEYAELMMIFADLVSRNPRMDDKVFDLVDQLSVINKRLWVVEDNLRLLEAGQDFGEDFVLQARSVYNLNDQRAALKKQINLLSGSNLMEEKSYKGSI
jgi:hypothetical protein